MFRSTLTSTTRAGVRNFSSTLSANSFARAQLLGRVGQDIVTNESSSGTKYVRYPLAVSYKKDGPVNWFNVITFNEQQIEFLTSFVNKGALVHIEANIQQDVYEKEDGTKAINYSYIQQRIDLLQNPRTEEAEAEESK
ncbi:hypothetical protein WICPIJ_004638 [Wickerhamomyces pijperi]|uniref:Single-stranded DNA-binding protein n=1 Tax=Wickerhamomyces pijperi TaxID=599730 RepID=A0A9P8Q7Q7_WICPI|nr:hypothetical protein WICPIJ_004638 [Wickerhamomyces pijperi]